MDDVTSRQLNKLKTECGCQAGSVALLVSVGAYVIHTLWMDPVTRSHLERVVTGICVGFAGALIGKILGILWARYQYHQLIGAQGHTETSSS
jgi:hypothetical protein